MEPWLHTIASLFYSHSAPVYLVGGAVRNMVLNLPVEDYDICGPLTPQEVESICNGSSVTPIGTISSFGTVGLKVKDIEGSHVAEYTTFRKDEYQGGHRPEKVTFIHSLKEDSLRRDFSINALYQPLLPDGLGSVCDPTGGLIDLENKRLHTVTPDPYQVLKDDGLRILRLIRFACDFNLTPSPSLVKTAREQVSLLKDIAPERICQELSKILLTDFRYPSLKRDFPLQKAFDLMNVVNCLPYIFPFGTVSPKGQQACCAYQAQTKNILPNRLSLLLCDVPLKSAEKNLWFLRLPKTTITLVMQTITAVQLFSSFTLDFLAQKKVLWQAVKTGEEIFCALPDLFRALKDYPRAEQLKMWADSIKSRDFPWIIKQLNINGNDLLPLTSGYPPQCIGQLLSTLHQEVVLEKVENTYLVLFSRAKSLLSSLYGCR